MPVCNVTIELRVTQKPLLCHLRDIPRHFGHYYTQLRDAGMGRMRSARGAVILAGKKIEVVS